jgi:S-DNA-T family DNA segregation ATPase FtsK/SpoIIIE
VAESFLQRPYLDRQADSIERALSSMDLPARVQGGKVGSHWVRYHLTPVSGTRADKVVQMAEEVADAIGVSGLRIAERSQGLTIDVPLQQGTELRLLPLLHALPGLSASTAVVGMSIEGRPLLFNLTRPSTWNLLVYAPKGYGKSELIRTLMMSLALTSRRSQLSMLGIDIGGRELAVLESLPHALTDLATEPKFAKEILTWLSEEAARRLVAGVASPHLVLLIDDLGWLTDEREGNALAALKHIGHIGVDVGVHFIAATQAPLPISLRDLTDHRGVVEVVPDENAFLKGKTSVGRFQFTSNSDVSIADVAWLSLRDLDTASKLAVAGWRATGMSPLPAIEFD